MHRRFKDRAHFLAIYVREAHPIDGWKMETNDHVGVSLAQPRTYEERVSVAQTCGTRLGLGFPMLVDTIDDTVGARYSGMPSRLYLIDHEGKVAYKSGRGPFGFKPGELEHALVMALLEVSRVGKEHLLSLDARPLDDASAWIESQRAEWTSRLAALDQLLQQQEPHAGRSKPKGTTI